MKTDDIVYIDGKNATVLYAVMVQGGGYGSLMQFPPLKTPEYNDWHEEDGIEPDLSEPQLDTREVSIQFVFFYGGAYWEDFFDAINDKAYHVFQFSVLGSREFKLRVTSNPNVDGVNENFALITFKFADDFPLMGYKNYLAPSSNIKLSDDYELDERPLNEYGVMILDGTLDNIKTSPAVKVNLLRNIKTIKGVIYDDKKVTFKAKDGKLLCLMRADSITELWRNWNALLYDLIRPDERMLYVSSEGIEYPCYYKSCAVTQFRAKGQIWLEFTLTLCFFSFRVGGADVILGTEAREAVVTEDGEYFIDLNRIVK